MQKVKDYLLKKEKSQDIIAVYHDKELTFAELHTASCEISSLLARIDADIVAIYLSNNLSYFISYFSILYSDKTVFSVSQLSGFTVLKQDIEFCQSNCVITSIENKAYFADNYKDIVCYDFIAAGITVIHIKSLPHGRMPRKDVCILLKTSGTTGHPNYVMLTDENLIHTVQTFCSYYNIEPQNKDISYSLNILPFSSSYGNAQMLVHFYAGVPLVIYEGNFTAEKFWAIIEKYKIPRLETIPTMVLKLLSDSSYQSYDISSLKTIGTGGAEMPASKICDFHKKFPQIKLVQSYGMSEAAPIISMMDLEKWLYKAGSVGRPNASLMEVALADDGEILVKGKNVMAGYFKDESSSHKVLADDWLHTGDFGRFDEDGYLYIIGRKKNMIISGGYNIIPEEIERVMVQMEGILDVLVYGKKHVHLGESVAAKVVLSAGSAVTKNEIRDFCKHNMEVYKIPLEIIFVESIERNITGKKRRVNDDEVAS